MGRGGRGGLMRRTRGGMGGLGPVGPGAVPPGSNQGSQRPGNGGKVPFDLMFFEDLFPRVAPAPDDTHLTTVRQNTLL